MRRHLATVTVILSLGTAASVVLRAMGCLRSEAGVRTRVVRNTPDGAWQVRFYPQGISGGVVLWGRPEAFTARDGSRPSSVTGT
jgi:hypothetical protein